MTRIQPECFIEVWKGINTTSGTCYLEDEEELGYALDATEDLGYKTIALFLIKPTSIPLAERLEARKAYQQNNVK
jgi:hypothetical protein